MSQQLLISATTFSNITEREFSKNKCARYHDCWLDLMLFYFPVFSILVTRGAIYVDANVYLRCVIKVFQNVQ